MPPELLDLRKHGADEFDGKIVRLHGAEYRFLELLGSGAEKFVHPIQNTDSGLVLYVGKVVRFLQGSPELAARANTRRATFQLLASDLPVVHTEYHEIPGGEMELQPYGVTTNPEYCEELMQAASAAFEKQDYDAALSAFDLVLQENGRHSLALLNKGLCLLNLQQPHEAIALAQQSIDIEPNFPQAYEFLASALGALGMGAQAVEVAENSLSRHSWTPDGWQFLIETALEHYIPEAAEKAIEELEKRGLLLEVFQQYVPKIKQCRLDADKCRSLCKEAHELQHKSDFERALQLLQQAVQANGKDRTARSNLLVCRYHVGERESLVPELFSQCLNSPRFAQPYFALLTILTIPRGKHADLSLQLALTIEKQFDHYVDIPGIPISIQESVSESLSAVPVISALEAIGESASAEHREKIQSLIGLYEVREKKFSKS